MKSAIMLMRGGEAANGRSPIALRKLNPKKQEESVRNVQNEEER